MPARKIPKNYRNLTGLIASQKGGGAPAFESSLERDLLILLDFDREVESIEEQPLTLEYTDPLGATRTYTPDFFVRYVDDRRPLLCEVKYRKDLFRDWSLLKPRLKAARRYATEQGWEFRILTENEIRTPYLENARFLREYRDLPVTLDQRVAVMPLLNDMRETTPAELTQAIFRSPWNRAEILPVVWHLMALGRIEADLTRPLSMSSRIWAEGDQ
ncbi:heteromeric transposase endonuclease subunit TnsA [Thioalkalivibrio sp. ALJ24]|uniref:heteromeric transposase endonuclease subunit TnsA n=1 Tax=Thioalkalivibrio sp. ALJ24 TaxID=545276 RepID=UPI00036DBF1D|nr:heteromeric transposase endonuclease subunit TnsA [Thioalkalivibrio sp. ALJ24]